MTPVLAGMETVAAAKKGSQDSILANTYAGVAAAAMDVVETSVPTVFAFLQ